MSTSAKDTIYVDIDDEITSLIDKVRGTQASIVALVLPKRATMLQSSVNMKLLKKAADSSKKSVVLITTETGLLPLASSIGMYVARNLQSKPEIPNVGISTAGDAIEELAVGDDEPVSAELDPKAAATQPVGELAGTAAAAEAPIAAASKAKPELTPMAIPRAKLDDADEAIELDNTDAGTDTAAAGTAAAATTKGSKASKDGAGGKKVKVPNFERFRLRLILAALLIIILVVGFILANIILPKATIAISTNTSSINSNLTLSLSPSAKTVSATQSTVPATVQTSSKSDSQQVNTTGQQNNGATASGSVTMTAQECSPNIPAGSPPDVPAGTGLSANGLTYITQNDTSFTYEPGKGGTCVDYKANNSTSITAQSAGSNYNISNATFTVSGRSDVSATGSASGGTDNIVQIVSQTDINNATQKLTTPSASSVKTALEKSLQQAGLYAVSATFNVGTPSTTQSANVGAQATTVTVTQTTTYTMLGVHKSDLQTVLNKSINQQINTSKQAILNNGLSNAGFSVLTNSGASGAQVTLQATGTVGPKLNVNSIKQQVAGQKTGDVENTINADPGVTSVSVHYSPFWVSSVPKHTSKITIQIKKSS